MFGLLIGIVILATILGGLGVNWIRQGRREDRLAAGLWPPEDDGYGPDEDLEDDDYDDEDEDGDDEDDDYDIEGHLSDLEMYMKYLGGRDYLSLPDWHYGYLADCEADSYHDGQEADRRRFRKSCGLAA